MPDSNIVGSWSVIMRQAGCFIVTKAEGFAACAEDFGDVPLSWREHVQQRA
jgi:hypothetical protein